MQSNGQQKLGTGTLFSYGVGAVALLFVNVPLPADSKPLTTSQSTCSTGWL